MSEHHPEETMPVVASDLDCPDLPDELSEHLGYEHGQALPTAGLLDAIGGRALDGYDWWVVGYGSEEAVNAPGGHTHPSPSQSAWLSQDRLV